MVLLLSFRFISTALLSSASALNLPKPYRNLLKVSSLLRMRKAPFNKKIYFPQPYYYAPPLTNRFKLWNPCPNLKIRTYFSMIKTKLRMEIIHPKIRAQNATEIQNSYKTAMWCLTLCDLSSLLFKKKENLRNWYNSS